MRLNIRVYSSQSTHQCSKYLAYLPQEIKTIKQAQAHLKDILEVEGELILRLGQYLLPKRESIKVLAQGSIVDCYVNNPISIKNISKTTKIRKSQNQQLDSQNSSQIQIRVQKSTKQLSKVPPRKQKVPIPSRSSQEDSSSESENQSNESFDIKKQMRSRVVVELPVKQKPVFLQANMSKKAINDEKLKNRANQLRVVSNSPKLLMGIQTRNQNPTTIIKPIQSRQQSLQDNLSKQHSRFKLVDLSKQKQFLSKATVPKNQPKSSPLKRQVTKSVVVQEIKSQPVSEWTEVPIKNVQNHLQTKGTGFLQSGDQIQYKVTQFDEEKYIPVLSDWISAKVQDVDGKGGLTLVQRGKLKKISQINLFGLKLKTAQLKLRESLLNNSPNIAIVQKELKMNQSPISQTQTPPVSKQKPEQPSKIDRLIEQFNYYFSDTNYFTDNYLKAHASKSKDSYISLKCFMNFNKLKPLIANENELETAIRSSDISNSNFQIHPQDKMIRKKGLTNL